MGCYSAGRNGSVCARRNRNPWCTAAQCAQPTMLGQMQPRKRKREAEESVVHREMNQKVKKLPAEWYMSTIQYLAGAGVHGAESTHQIHVDMRGCHQTRDWPAAVLLSTLLNWANHCFSPPKHH